MSGNGAVPRDDHWFDSVVHEHASAVVRYFVRRLPDGGSHADSAEDLAAEVFAIAWRRRDAIPVDRLGAWLFTVAGNVLANHRRKSSAVPLESVPETPVDDDPADFAVNDDAVRRALSALEPRDRQILLLVAWDGLGGSELAEVLGISRGGADAALSRARSRLREAWAASLQDSAAV